ncbi:MAG: PAS domain-containing protein [Cytophagales bacterium]|nr:PAS domain-containing protein [Cytophagales bacterium]
MEPYFFYIVVSVAISLILFVFLGIRRVAFEQNTSLCSYMTEAGPVHTLSVALEPKEDHGQKEPPKHIEDDPKASLTTVDQTVLAASFDKVNKIFLEQASNAKINQIALSEICKQVRCLQGALYKINDEKELLALVAGYGLTNKAERETVDYGQGQLGQAVVDNEPIILRNIPKGYVQIASGLGETEPTWIGLFPLSFKGKAYGVLEMCFLHPESEATKNYLVKVSELFGAHFFNQNVNAKQSQLQQLEQEKLKTEAILEGCADGFIGFNKAGVIDFCNKSAAQLVGKPKKDVLGQLVNTLLDIDIEVDEDNDTFKIVHHGMVKTTLTEKTEIQITDAHGEPVSVLVTANSVSFADDFLFTLFIQKISVDLF